MKQMLLCCLLAVLGTEFDPCRVCATAPPVSPRWLASELHQLEQLEERAEQAAQKGSFAEALRLSRQALAARRRLQGARHFETIDAALLVERLLRLAALPASTQRQVGQAWRNGEEGIQLQGRGQLAQAEQALRQALRIKRKALGEDHPDTTTSCNTLGNCLHIQGKRAEALPLYNEALATRRKVLGEDHPDTAISYNSLAYCLASHGKLAEALPLARKALAISRKVLGEEHPHTAHSASNVAFCLRGLGKPAEALPLFQKALAISRTVLGEDHSDTARSYNNVASCLNSLGKRAEALPLYQKALRSMRRALGEEHPSTATGYNNVAFCLSGLGRRAEALTLYRKALQTRRQVLGEDHPDTAASYNNVALCLDGQGKSADALPLLQKALAISRKVLGEEHPETADSYNNLACCLHGLGRPAEALPLFHKALKTRRRALGEDHPQTAASSSNVASCLLVLGKPAEAFPLLAKVLQTRRQVLGEEHPDTALGYNNLAGCLNDLGKPAQALPLFHKALGISRKVLGEEHPRTAHSASNVAFCLHDLGKRDEAIRHLRLALLGSDVSRQSATAASAGFERSLFAATQQQGRPLLACLLAGEGKVEEAWQHAEAHLGRGLLDRLAGPAVATENVRRAELARLEARLLPLLSVEKPSAAQQEARHSLGRQHRRLLTRMAREAADRLNKLVWSYQEVQKHLPADSAVLLWLDAAGEHWGCVLRQQGKPRWARLPGSGKAGLWTTEDSILPARVHEAIRQPATSPDQTTRRIEQLRRQRLAPLQKHLKAEGKLPAVRRLIVLPVDQMAAVPVEVLAPGYIVSYAPSATLLARARAVHRPLRGEPLLALGDPQFSPPRQKPAEPPSYGLLLRLVPPGSNASRAGLRPGDVLLRYNNQRLHSIDDLQPSTTESVRAVRWREGTEEAVRLGPGPLGAVFDPRSARAAVRAWLRAEQETAVRGSRHAALPGTAFEVAALRRLVGEKQTTLLTGSLASEQQLERMAQAGYLKQFRVLHFATHGEVDWQAPERSALILAQDRLPDPLEQARQGRKVYDGHLRVATILRDWELDADLVVLSACQTGLGKDAGGEGLLSFAQAFLQKGARSVVLSRWKVDDTATALLMVRFYENLLGKRTELKQALGRAEALAEAKQWLAGLKRREAEALAVRLAGGVLRGTEGDVKPLVKGKGAKLPEGERPFAHPFYWAAFVLVGDPS